MCKEWDQNDDSGIEKGKVGLKREERDCVGIVVYSHEKHCPKLQLGYPEKEQHFFC